MLLPCPYVKFLYRNEKTGDGIEIMIDLAMTIRMCVREHAEQVGITNPTELSRRLRIGLSTARRLWFSTSDGLERGEPLQRVDFEVLDKLCVFFDVPPGEFLEWTKTSEQ